MGRERIIKVYDLKYKTITRVLDFGPATTKLLLFVGEQIAEEIDVDSFEIFVAKYPLKYPMNGKLFNTSCDSSIKNNEESIESGRRSILTSYVSNEKGEADKNGLWITFELAVHPSDSLCLITDYVNDRNFLTSLTYKIQLNEKILLHNGVISPGILEGNNSDNEIEYLEKFDYYISKCKELPLQYALFNPSKTQKRPLIIWLHGAGEGGTEVTLPLICNRANQFVSPDFQKIFGGAYVLAPQCPTMWMDDGSGEYTLDGSSKYDTALMALIDEVIEGYNIDKDRVYICGASNGGYMTLKMLLLKPEMFAAAMPVCQAYQSRWITEDEIKRIKDIPMWFVHVDNDDVIPADIHTTAIVDRLLELGAEKILYSLYDNVIDTSGKYFDKNGNPYEYNGHMSWIYALNNHPDFSVEKRSIANKKVYVLNWLSQQSL